MYYTAMKSSCRLVSWLVPAVLAVMAARADELDLTGVWSLTRADDVGVTCPATVPGGIYKPLVDAKLIPHPYCGLNEAKVQEPAEKEWVFSRTFVVPEKMLKAKILTLRLEDVDCFATVKLNGLEIGKTSNRFQRHDFDVRAALRSGENAIEVRFAPTGKISAEETMKYGKDECPYGQAGTRHLQTVRTVRSHAGWDWGLTLMDTGLMGPVKLIATDVARLDYLYTAQEFNADYSSCTVTVTGECVAPETAETDFSVSLCGALAKRKLSLARGHNAFSVSLKVDHPKLWWPRGYGEQPLQTLAVTFAGEKTMRKIGFRKVELRNKPDKIGTSFTFVCNGTPIYCQGANWVPCDAMENLQTPERYRNLLESAARANMNMIRVWGGGQFEHDAFYDICDELGLVVWQDFLFACAIYSVSDYFMDPIRKELAHQLRRLRDHPSIGLWCGDNECVHVANHQDNRKFIDACGVREKILTELVAKYDPTRPFWPASPLRAPGNYERMNQLEGDYHDWGVWYGLLQFGASYDMQARFISEFGFQSHMSPETLAKWIPADRLNPNTPEVHSRQKCKVTKRMNGDDVIHYFVNDTFLYPESVDRFYYLSQLNQALAVKHAVAAWRPVRERCGGMLIWQLNDNWPATSWSTVEYGGKWKQAQYVLKRGYAPVAVFLARRPNSSGTLQVRAVNDRAVALKGAVRVTLNALKGGVGRPVGSEIPVSLAPHEGRVLGELKLADLGDTASKMRTYLRATLSYETDGESRTLSDEWFFERFRCLELVQPKVSAEVTAQSDGRFAVRLATDVPAFFVWLNATDIRGEFSDNAVTLHPGEPRTLVFTPEKSGLTVEAFRRALTVHHL